MEGLPLSECGVAAAAGWIRLVVADVQRAARVSGCAAGAAGAAEGGAAAPGRTNRGLGFLHHRNRGAIGGGGVIGIGCGEQLRGHLRRLVSLLGARRG